MKKWVIFYPGFRSYLFGFRDYLWPMFGHLGIAIKFDTKKEAERYMRAYFLNYCEVRQVLVCAKDGKE